MQPLKKIRAHETFFVDVIIPLGVPNKFTYRVPVELEESIAEGKRALVQFGKSKIYTGIIYKIHHAAPREYTVKYIDAVLDETPIVTPLQLQFWDWLSFYYCANPGEVMNAALPSGLKLSSTSHIQLNPDFNFEESSHTVFTEREHLLLDALHATPNLDFEAVSELLQIKAIQPILNTLLKKNAIVIYEEVKDKYKPKLQSYLKLRPELANDPAIRSLLDTLEKKAFKQAEALLYFLHLSKTDASGLSGWIKKTELLKKTETGTLASLVKKGILQEEQFEVGRLLFEKSRSTEKHLSQSQTLAYEQTKKGFEAGKPVLLHGVTGSGKTEVYIRLIRDALAQNKEVLFLIPEIALTTQLITRLRAIFGELVGVYHSRFSENERVEIWNNVLQSAAPEPAGETGKLAGPTRHYKIILGARSSVFLPFSNLGLIIVDEEHDSSFKQHDPSPRYQARDAALYLATLHKAHIVLGSATPSVESYYNARESKYQLVEIKNQFVESGGTRVEICDVKLYEQRNQMKASLTQPLFDAVEKALLQKKQVILFQNRRGFAPYTECRQCGHVPHCVQCDVSLIYHKQSQKLTCHYCGYTISPPKVCSACGSNQLHFKGMGTEKIEEDVEILFPKAKVARMDLDSTRSKYAYKQLIDDFEAGTIDILVGTQMVTKGLDFDHVAVVGVLNADSSFNFPDFRSFEKSFQLITQVRGRAGRKKEKGEVFVQTSQPQHPVLDYILQNNFQRFFEDTLREREQFFYPPFSRLIEISLISRDVNEVNHLAADLFNLLKPSFPDNLLGPEFPLIARIKNQYYKRILIKTSRKQSPQLIRQMIFAALNELQSSYKNWRYKVALDIDPV